MSFSLRPIAYLRTCFKQKFGIPRQSGLASEATGVIEFENDPLLRQALKGIEGFSHVWVIFVFHEPGSHDWKPSIRPPRLGGAKKMGVLASRSPHRPNPIGMSALKLDRVDLDAPEGARLHVSGVDILDGSPVLDVKPYLPYADAIPKARSGWAKEQIDRVPVDLTPQAEESIARFSEIEGRPLKGLILQVLELDPRPAFQKKELAPAEKSAQGTRFGFRLLDYDVKWTIANSRFLIEDVVLFSDTDRSKRS